MNLIKATRLPICYRNHHLHRPDIDMDDMRKSLSKLKKDFKHRVGGKKRGPDRAGVDADWETASPPPSLTRPDSPVAASGRDEEGSGISTGVSQARPRDRSPQPNPMQADEGGGNPQGGGAGINEKEASRSYLGPAPDIRNAAGNRPSREITRAPSPLSVTPISPKQEPDST